MGRQGSDEQGGPAAWVEHADGTWSVVDEYGFASETFVVIDGKAFPIDSTSE
ncbi:hypothetical protein ABZW96_04040 [Nocardia sp. NPDC004168]|uniref:hypothetical protein n=1 Tax=Nocardia sp. NPDC004168 TaxID=3154452 RepID=UPI0033B7C3C3